MMNRSFVAMVLLAAVAGPTFAVRPATWTHATEADFSAGKLDKTVVSSLGEVMLARALKTLVEPDKTLGMVSALAVDPKGRVYLAASPSGVIYRLEKGKLVELATLPGVLVRALVFVGDRLVAGVTGEGSGLYRIDAGGEVKALWRDAEVTSVWAVLPAPKGAFFVGTGPRGRVYRVRPDGKSEVIYDSDEKNILSLAAGPDGRLYAGTGENGLIVEIDPAGKSGRVLYDAPEKEISALLVDADGVLYAATSDSSLASGSGEAPSTEQRGKPDSSAPARPGTRRTIRPAVATRRASQTPMPGAKTRPAGRGSPRAAAPGGRVVRRVARAGARPMRVPPEIAAAIAKAKAARAAASSPPARSTPAGGRGNAVYRIDADGFVRAVFRRPVTILSMVLQKGTLLLGTGHGGQVFAVEVQADRATVLTKVDPKDVTSLAVDATGRVYLGTAGQAGLFVLGRGYARKGTCISKPLDAKQISRWGTLRVLAEVPPGCGVTVATRSGNVAEPDEKTWSPWSAEAPLGERWARIASPPGRFLQYRLTLSSTGAATPEITQVQLVYQIDNLAPIVSAVRVVPSPKPQPPRGKGGTEPLRYRIVQAKATDPNGDALRYSVYFRRRGRRRWIRLAEKLSKPLYAWDTLAVADGSYEVRVVASDAGANPPAAALEAGRVSRAVVVDNTPPQVTDLLVAVAGKGKVKVSGTVADATARIASIAYAVDTNDEWTTILPADGIADSRRERFATTIKDLEEGTHRVAVRVTDEFNNTGYASVEVTVGK